MIFDIFKVLFKRKKVKSWEIDFLKTVFSKLSGDENRLLYEQIIEGIIKRVFIGYSYIPNYVGFSYNTSIVEKYENNKIKNYKLSNIKVKNSLTNEYIYVSIFVFSGLVTGYSIDTNKKIKKYQFSINSVDVSSVQKIFDENKDYEKISSLLNNEELKYISNEVYPTEINGKYYYHIKELEDGDFIGIDINNHIYKITHDPYEIVSLERNKLLELLQKPTAKFY